MMVVRALSEIGAEAHAIFADQIDRVVDRLHAIHHGRVDAPPQEGREHGHADEAAAIGDEAQLLVAQLRGCSLSPSGRQWESHTGLADRAASVPGVTLVRDEGGREAARFRALASGLTVLYGADGRRLFSGGITASRGHEGDSFGRRRLLALLDGRPTDRDDSPVFGCTLGVHANPSDPMEVMTQ